jgi:hypothetical protein
MATNLYLERMSHSFNTITLQFYAFKFLVFYNFNILRILKRATHLFLRSEGISEDGTPVPKPVGTNICHKLYFIKYMCCD